MTALLMQSFPNPIWQIEHHCLKGQNNWHPLTKNNIFYYYLELDCLIIAKLAIIPFSYFRWNFLQEKEYSLFENFNLWPYFFWGHIICVLDEAIILRNKRQINHPKMRRGPRHIAPSRP